MPTYTCEKCNKAFAKKNDYTRHAENRKTDCTGKTVEQLAAEKAAAMLEVKNVESGSSALIINLVKQLHDLMRNRDTIIGQKAFHDIIRLLLLRFMQPHLVPNGRLADLLEPHYYLHTIKNFTEKDISLLNFDVLANNFSETSEFESNIKKVWFMLHQHPVTQNIFAEKGKFYCSPVTLGKCMELIGKTLDEINFDDLGEDVKGQIYEHFINNYASNGGKAFGQYFTPRNLIKRAAELNKILFPDMQPENVYDPCAGTCGFLTETLKHFPIQPENVYGGEIEPDTFTTGIMNLILATGSTCQLKNHDSLTENSLQQYDWIVTNPPFGVKQKYAELIERGQGKPIKTKRKSQVSMEYFDMADDMYPVKTNDGSALFLQHCICKLATGGVCNIVLPDGQLMSGKSFKALREYLIENCVLKAVLKVPSGAFEHAGVQTCVLFFQYIPGYNTEVVDFYETDKKCILLNKVGSVNFADLPEDHNKPLSWQMHKQQIIERPIESNWEIKTLGEVCSLQIGGTPSRENKSYFEGNIPWVSVRELNNNVIIDTTEKLTEAGVKNSKLKNVQKGSVLVSINLSVGKLAIAGVDLYTNQAIVGVNSLDSNYLNNMYVYYYLSGFEFQKLARGCIGNGSINKDILSNIPIPIPSLEKQQEIINKCQQYDQKIKLLQTNIENNNQVKPIIKELYIDTLFNGETKKLGEIAELKAGKFTTSSNNPEGKYPFYTGNAENPSHKHDDYCFDGQEYLILTKDGNISGEVDVDTRGIGKTYYACGRSAGTSGQVGIYCHNQILVKYLYYYLSSVRANIIQLSTTSNGLGHISIESLRDINVPVPTMEKQQEIIVEYEAIQKEKFEQLEQTNKLYEQLIETCQQNKKQLFNH